MIGHMKIVDVAEREFGRREDRFRRFKPEGVRKKLVCIHPLSATENRVSVLEND